MQIATLTLKNFRNFEDLGLDFSPGINLLIGPNAQGKTNILEAIHYLSTTRSFRAKSDQDLIRFGADLAYLSGGGVEAAIEVGQRQLRVGGKLARAAEALGTLR